MKINYTAILLTILALAGLSIYRLLTPDDCLMILSKPGQPNAFYLVKSSDGLHWNTVNEYEPIPIHLSDNAVDWQMFKESNYKYSLIYTLDEYLMISRSNNLIGWENPRLIETQDGSKPDFSEITKIRLLYEKGEPIDVFGLRNEYGKSELLLFRINDEKIMEGPLKLIDSEQQIVDFQAGRLKNLYVLTLMYKDSISGGLNIGIFQSTSIDKDWILATSLHTDSEDWSESVLLQKNNREFWLYGKQNRIISVKTDRETNEVTMEILTEKSGISSDYNLKSGIRMRRDVLKNLEKELKR